MNMMQDIPKIYTALAEWAACLILILSLKRRHAIKRTALYLGVLLILLICVQIWIGAVPVAFWIPGMIMATILMYAGIRLCCDIPSTDAAFFLAIAFVFAEFAASFEWQLYSFAAESGFGGVPLQTAFLFVCYGGTFFLFYIVEKKRIKNENNLYVTNKEAFSAATIALGTFLISNISYVYQNTPFSGRMSMEIFYIRTLVDFAGVAMLVALQDRWQEMLIKQELDSIHSILQRQYEQYCQSRESINLINRKYHDLKHQIVVIRKETDEKKREAYLNEMESDLYAYEAQNRTGNSVLDTILTGKQMYCVQHDINMTSVIDGEKLNFMNAMDICSIFGNTLDNAIESVSKITDKDKRLIRIAVYGQNDFLVIRVENYYENSLKMREGNYITTKGDKAYHGYGIKSIKYTAEKYGGTMTIHTQDSWFCLNVLIPMRENGIS
ncbi:ATP-binding protein [Konateibacter massiliensis]|uniref:ATP-binding protein n=1 Tax=Konateibacter massiliensis TaxID=2002841 RepID=UPI001F3100A6|nr:ATP-binding protein [Konateibacter massiliensis]